MANFYLHHNSVDYRLLDTAPPWKEWSTGIPAYSTRTHEFRHIENEFENQFTSALNNSHWEAGTITLFLYASADNVYQTMRFSVVRFNSDFTSELQVSPLSTAVPVPNPFGLVTASISMTWTAGNATDKLALRTYIYNGRNLSGSIRYRFELSRLATPITHKVQGQMIMKFL